MNPLLGIIKSHKVLMYHPNFLKEKNQTTFGGERKYLPFPPFPLRIDCFLLFPKGSFFVVLTGALIPSIRSRRVSYPPKQRSLSVLLTNRLAPGELLLLKPEPFLENSLQR